MQLWAFSLIGAKVFAMNITSIAQLRELYGHPGERAVKKELRHLDRHMQAFIALSPFVVLSSSDVIHQLDASPRGGAPGFVKVHNETTLWLPDAPGNNRLDTLENVVSTGRLGLLFFIPGVDEMLRVQGHATLTTATEVLNTFSDTARPPKLVIDVAVESAYLHCAKAMMRSKLWSPHSKVERSVLPTMGEMIKEQAQLSEPAESQAEMLRRYADSL